MLHCLFVIKMSLCLKKDYLPILFYFTFDFLIGAQKFIFCLTIFFFSFVLGLWSTDGIFIQRGKRKWLLIMKLYVGIISIWMLFLCFTCFFWLFIISFVVLMICRCCVLIPTCLTWSSGIIFWMKILPMVHLMILRLWVKKWDSATKNKMLMVFLFNDARSSMVAMITY